MIILEGYITIHITSVGQKTSSLIVLLFWDYAAGFNRFSTTHWSQCSSTITHSESLWHNLWCLSCMITPNAEAFVPFKWWEKPNHDILMQLYVFFLTVFMYISDQQETSVIYSWLLLIMSESGHVCCFSFIHLKCALNKVIINNILQLKQTS